MNEESEQLDLTYEQALQLLDQQVGRVESGELSLEQAVEAVNSAYHYLDFCRRKLDEARHSIEVRPQDDELDPDGNVSNAPDSLADAPVVVPDEIPF